MVFDVYLQPLRRHEQRLAQPSSSQFRDFASRVPCSRLVLSLLFLSVTCLYHHKPGLSWRCTARSGMAVIEYRGQVADSVMASPDKWACGLDCRCEGHFFLVRVTSIQGRELSLLIPVACCRWSILRGVRTCLSAIRAPSCSVSLVRRRRGPAPAGGRNYPSGSLSLSFSFSHRFSVRSPVLTSGCPHGLLLFPLLRPAAQPFQLSTTPVSDTRTLRRVDVAGLLETHDPINWTSAYPIPWDGALLIGRHHNLPSHLSLLTGSPVALAYGCELCNLHGPRHGTSFAAIYSGTCFPPACLSYLWALLLQLVLFRSRPKIRLVWPKTCSYVTTYLIRNHGERDHLTVLYRPFERTFKEVHALRYAQVTQHSQHRTPNGQTFRRSTRCCSPALETFL